MTSISLHVQKRWMSPHLHRWPHPCPCKRHNPWCHQWSSNPVQWIIISHRNIETRCFRSLFFALLLGTWEVWPWQHCYKLMVLSSDLEDSTLKTLLTLSPHAWWSWDSWPSKNMKKQSAKPINLHKMPARREQGGVKVEGRFWQAIKQASKSQDFTPLMEFCFKKTAQNNGPNGWKFPHKSHLSLQIMDDLCGTPVTTQKLHPIQFQRTFSHSTVIHQQIPRENCRLGKECNKKSTELELEGCFRSSDVDSTFLWPVKVGTAHQVQSCSARSACRRYRRIGSIHWLFVAEDDYAVSPQSRNTTRLLVWFRQHILNRMIFCLSCFKTPALLAENLDFCTLSQWVY